jgi:hypothetical protein
MESGIVATDCLYRHSSNHDCFIIYQLLVIIKTFSLVIPLTFLDINNLILSTSRTNLKCLSTENNICQQFCEFQGTNYTNIFVNFLISETNLSGIYNVREQFQNSF